jgi:hypothetical protein
VTEEEEDYEEEEEEAEEPAQVKEGGRSRAAPGQ